MNNDPKAVINDVFPQMIEELTFLFADPVEGGAAPGIPHDAVVVSIAFSGERSGTLDMGIGRSLGIEMAANLLGLDPEADNAAALGDDALRELMNVTCGHVLTSLAGDKPVFNLTIPEVRPVNGAEWDALGQGHDTAQFSVDGRPVQMRLRLDA